VAVHYPIHGPPKKDIETPLTLTALQLCVGGFIRFIELPSGDILVVNEATLDGIGYENSSASKIAGRAVLGDVVICHPSEIA
jgi:hypothetical protein